MSDETYNGWRNAETWRVQLHFTSDEGESHQALNHARWCIRSPLFDNVCGDPVDDPRPDAADGLAEYLRGYVAYQMGGPLRTDTWGMFKADVVDAALARVDWEQIAAHWLDAARHELASGAAK
jgi:hypothetical protein